MLNSMRRNLKKWSWTLWLVILSFIVTIFYVWGVGDEAARSGLFVASVNGAERNQGIFVADEQGLHPIAIGCGGGGGSGDPGSGCGDPSPIGGTFSGFFQGTVFAPPINVHGDVLFMADVDGGSSPRGLFLYSSATGW